MTTQDYALLIEPHFVKNFWPGRDGYMPMALVEHMMQGTIEETFRYFNGEEGPYYVSAHYGIARDGRVWQFVRDEDTAWANGVLNQPDLSLDWIKEVYEEGVNANLITLSIEYEGFSGESLTEPQYEATLELHRRLLARWEIPVDADHIIGHDRFDSVDRKLNPGPAFPWSRLLADLQAGVPTAEAATGTAFPKIAGAGLASVGGAAIALNSLVVAPEPSAVEPAELEEAEAAPEISGSGSDLPAWLRDEETNTAIPDLVEPQNDLPPLNLPDLETEEAAENTDLPPLDFAGLRTEATIQAEDAELPPLNLPDFEPDAEQAALDALPPLNLPDLDQSPDQEDISGQMGELPPLNLYDLEPEATEAEAPPGELPPLNLPDLDFEAAEAEGTATELPPLNLPDLEPLEGEPQAGELPPLNLTNFEPLEAEALSAELPPLNLPDLDLEPLEVERETAELPPLNLPDFEPEFEPVEARAEFEALPPLNLPELEPEAAETVETKVEPFELPPLELPDFEPEPEPLQVKNEAEDSVLPPLSLADFEPELVETKTGPEAVDDSDIFDFLKTPPPPAQEKPASLEPDLRDFEPNFGETKAEAADLPPLNLADFEPELQEAKPSAPDFEPFELPNFEAVAPKPARESLPPLEFDFPEVKPDREEEAASETTQSAIPDLPSWLNQTQTESEEARPFQAQVSEPLNFELPQLDQEVDAEVRPGAVSLNLPDLNLDDRETTRDEESLPFSLADLEKEMAAGSALPDWLTSDSAGRDSLPPLDFPELEQESAPASADLPDWLRSSQAQAASPTFPVEGQETEEAPSTSLPDWMKSYSAEPIPEAAPSQPETVATNATPEADLPSWMNNMREEAGTGTSEAEGQLRAEVQREAELASAPQTQEAEPDLMYPFPVDAPPRPLETFPSGKSEADEPEVADAWPMPRQVQPQSFEQSSTTQSEAEAAFSLPLFEGPENRSAPPAVSEPETHEKTVEVVPSGKTASGRDPLDELDDLIFDDQLPPGLTEDQLPSAAEVTSSKPDLPDFADFDNLFDEISGLGDPVTNTPVKPFEVEGAPRSSAPIVPPPAPKEEAPPAPPSPDDRAELILAQVGGGAVAVELANVRKRPSYDPSTVIRTAAKNTRFKFDGYREGPELQGSTRWYHISPEDGSGWIHSALVQLDQPFNPVAQ